MDIARENLTQYLNAMILQRCRHQHGSSYGVPAVLEQIRECTTAPTPKESLNKLQEILCVWTRQPHEEELPMESLLSLVANKQLLLNGSQVVLYLFKIVSGSPQGITIVKQLIKPCADEPVKILMQYYIWVGTTQVIDKSIQEDMENLCCFLGHLQYHQNPTLLTAIQYLIKKCLYICLLASQGLVTADQSIEQLGVVKQTEPYFGSKQAFDVFVQNIYLLSAQPNTFLNSLMDWICNCFTSQTMSPYVSKGNYVLVELSHILLKVWELYPKAQLIKRFLKALKVRLHDSVLSQQIVKLVLMVNSQKVLEDNLVQLIDFDIKNLYSAIYEKILPYALKCIDKIKQNIILVNYIVHIRLTIQDDWSVSIKNDVFNKFFQHVCHFLTSENLMLLYHNLDNHDNRALLQILTSKNKHIFPTLQSLLAYLLPEDLVSNLDPTKFAMVVDVLSQLINKLSKENKDKIQSKYRQRLHQFCSQTNSIECRLKLIEFESSLERQFIDQGAMEQIKLVGAQLSQSDEVENYTPSVLLAFGNHPNKTSTLSLLKLVFFLSVSKARYPLQQQKLLETLRLELESFHYSKLRCYSREVFDQILILYSTQGVMTKALQILEQIMLIWINYTGMRQIHHIYQISKYESSSDFLQDRIKQLKVMSPDRDCRIFKTVDARLLNFLGLFYRIVSYQNLQKADSENKCVIYSPSDNKVTLVYKFLQNSYDRTFEVLLTLHNNPRHPQPCNLVLRQSTVQYSFDIDHKIRLYKNTKMVEESKAVKTQTLLIKLEVDMEKQRATVDINKQQFQVVVLRNYSEEGMNVKNTHAIEIVLQTTDSYLQSVDVMYNTIKKLAFNMNTNNQALKKFTLNIRQLNTMQIFKEFQYLSLKYLFVFILQIAKNELSYSLHSVQMIFPLLYKVVFYHLEFPNKNEFYGLFTFLEYVTRAIINITENVNLAYIGEQTVKLMAKPNRMTFEYYRQIILNFDIWSSCSFAVQSTILNITRTILHELPVAAKLISEDISCFDELLQASAKISSVFLPSKNLNNTEKQQLSLLFQEVLLMMVTSTNETMFPKYISQIVMSYLQQRESKSRRRSLMETSNTRTLVQDIVNYCLESPNTSKHRQELIIAFFKIKQLRAISQNISLESSELLLVQMFKLCKAKDQPIEIYTNLKALLHSLPLVQIEKYFDQVLLFLQDTNKHTSQEKLITSLLLPYLYRYVAFSTQTRNKLLTYLTMFYLANTVPMDQKSTAFSVRLMASPQFAQMMTNLVEDIYTQSALRTKSVMLVDICFELLKCMTKKTLFEFLFNYRRKSDSRLRVQAELIQRFDVTTRSITDCSLMIQYALECLLSVDNNKSQNSGYLFKIVCNMINQVVQHKPNMVYNCEPALEKTNISNSKIVASVSKPFQIRGGILFKLILLVMQYFEASQDVKALQVLETILIHNVNKSEEVKNFKKLRRSGSIFNFEMSNKAVAHDQFDLVVKNTTKVQSQKEPATCVQVGQNLFDGKGDKSQDKLQKFEVSLSLLEYVVLKLAIYKQDFRDKPVKASINKLISELVLKYPHISQQFDSQSDALGQTYQYHQFVKMLREKVGDNAQMNKLEVSPTFRRTLSSNVNTAPFMKHRKPSTNLPLINESEKQIEDNVTEVPSPNINRENAPAKAFKLLKIQFTYHYLIRSNINQKEDGNSKELEDQKMLRNWKKYNQKQEEVKTANKNQMHLRWKSFLSVAEAADGLLYEKIHKKKPILKLRARHLPNMVRGITKETSDYNYELTKQTIDITKKQSFLSYSFLKPRSVLGYKQRNSLVQMIPATFQQSEQSGATWNYKCEWITRRGVYFCDLTLNVNDELITLESDVKGRPDTKEYAFGSVRDTIIKQKSKSKSITFKDIKQVQIRKYNQIPNNSVQIFTHNCSSFYIMFYDTKVVRKILDKLLQKLKPEQVISNCQVAFRENKYMEKWQAGKISNFDYLMLLNIYSGRTFNDPCQYPIFPWVIQDYTSHELNLAKPEHYRDLAVPIGALNPEKLKRYIQNSRVQAEDEDYLYGSLMSTSMFVFYYLVRIEPFSSLAMQLQGGSFDSPDRLFACIQQVWSSVTCESNTSDVKELIPQFYSVNVFLENVNKLNLGKTQSGMVVGDVKLPPWAKDSNTFISIMREALQSDIVSSKLHLWIDLIFGNHQYSKQRHNQFHPRYYQENIDFKEVQPHQIQALIAQITYFGQFPKKLFQKDHPARIQPVKRSLKLKIIYKEDLTPGIVQKIKKGYNNIVLSIFQSKLSKSFAINIPFEGQPKRLQVDKSAIPKSGQLVIVDSKAEMLYYKSSVSMVFLKKYNIKIRFRKSVCNSRIIVLMGRDLTVMNLEGTVLLTVKESYPQACAILENCIAYVDSSMQLRRVSLLSPYKPETLYRGDQSYCHVQLVGYKKYHQEGYVLCFDRAHLVYLSY